MASIIIDLYGDTEDGLVKETKLETKKEPQPKEPPVVERLPEPGLQIIPVERNK